MKPTDTIQVRMTKEEYDAYREGHKATTIKEVKQAISIVGSGVMFAVEDQGAKNQMQTAISTIHKFVKQVEEATR